MEQLLAHIFGDYVLQSDYLAQNKNKQSIPCLVHVLIYTSIFLLFTTSWKALLVIGGTHFIIDRFPGIIKKLIWWKNHINPNLSYAPYRLCNMTGCFDNIKNELNNDIYVKKFAENQKSTDPIEVFHPRLNYITAWLYIITDNFFHLTINYLAIKYLS